MGMRLPKDQDVSGAAFSLLILPITYRFHPIQLAEGQIRHRQTNARLNIESVTDVAQECLSSSRSLFLDTTKFYFENKTSQMKHYAGAIEWMEAAEM